MNEAEFREDYELARRMATFSYRSHESYLSYLGEVHGPTIMALRLAAERDEAAIAAWREVTWPVIKGRRRTWAPGSASKTSPARA